MKTVQHTKSTKTVHEIRMEGPVTARDIGDFLHQVSSIFENAKGRNVSYDDDYIVTGDEEGGITATFTTRGKKEKADG